MLVYNYLYRQCRSNKITPPLVPESPTIDLYRSNYKKEKQIGQLQLPISNIYNVITEDIIDNRVRDGTISIEFINNRFNRDHELYDVNNGFLVDNLSLKFEGPAKCEIVNLKLADIDREFGYIQTVKIFIEGEYEERILYSDFQSNLLENQEEVLDIFDGNVENIHYKPFYSENSCYKLAANQMPSNNRIELSFLDRPRNSRKLEFQFQFPEIQKEIMKGQKRYLQNFVYLVMRSKFDENWKYDVLYSFDWFVYSNWQKGTLENNSKYEYNYGVNCHESKRSLPNIDDQYVCNRDQFQYWMCIKNNKLFIDIINYPSGVSNAEKNKFLDRVKKILMMEIDR